MPSRACSTRPPTRPGPVSTRWASASASSTAPARPTVGGAPFGVYVHIPFCLRRCDYCAFATWDDRGELLGDYLDALVREIDEAGTVSATSVFFGGGTPSLLSPDQLSRVLARVPTVPGAEVTVECNPDTVDLAKLRGYRAAGVSRISLGVQSMLPHVLAALGRTHDPDNVERAAEAIAEAGFGTWNLDLIYGAVGESLDDWRATLAAALRLRPTHVSAYGLTVEAGTPLAAQPRRHPDDDDQADKYELADELLAEAGLRCYEVSNWAVPGHECAHNRVYWSQGDYRGFGCAAHSHRAGRRWWNVRTPERYIAMLAAGQSVEAAAEDLDAEERTLEGLQLSLRTTEGVPAWALDTDGLESLVTREGDRIVLTRDGRLLANEVAVRLRSSPSAR